MTGSKNTAWIAGTGVLAVLILVASYFLLIAPKRAEASDIATQVAGVEQSNQTLAAETERLKAQFATLAEQRAELASIEAELPAEAEVPDLIRQLSASATQAGLTVKTIAPGSLTPYTSSSGDAAAAGTAAGTSILTMPLSVTVSGSFAGTELFVKYLQADMHRYVLVDGVSLVQGDSALTTTITGHLFVLQSPASTDATATTGTTSGTTTGTTTTTTASTGATTSAATSTGTVS